MRRWNGIYPLITILFLAVTVGCSTKKNTAGSRFYHSFTTRYNVYFNGNEAYKEGLLAIQSQNKDNYMDRISFYPIGNPSTIGAGSSNFDRAIEKSQKAIRQHSIKRRPVRRPGARYTDEYKQWLKRGEFNPFLHNAWMLMGKAQFHKGDFVDATATFSYVMRLYEGQPKITAEAGIWLARCYTELEWYYEAEDILGKVNNDSLPVSLLPLHSATYGNLLMEQERFREGAPYLLTAIKNEKNKKQKARLYYLLGQVYQQTGEKNSAYSAYGKVIRMNPAYELELNARIRQTEVMPAADSDKIINRLRRMARDGKNKDYLDQVYYALGNAYLVKNDTVKAIAEFLQGVEKSTRNGVEKGMLQLRLGNIFWQQARYAEAQTAYADAISLIDKEYSGYKLLNERSEVLDQLVTHTTAIHLQDSLQHLASLSEPERIKVIEELMAEIARKEEEARKAEELRQRQSEQTGSIAPAAVSPAAQPGGGGWYFYNPQLVTQGKVDFERNWGRRKLEDNWRRKNKTVVNLDEFAEVDYDAPDSMATVRDSMAIGKDSLAVDSTAIDGKGLEYYLSQIPLTEEAMKESNDILSDALYHLGLIYKDKLNEYPLAERTFARLITQFPDFPQTDEALYNLFLMYSRWDKPLEAEQHKDSLIARFPESRYALILGDPEYRYNAMYGKHLEDSLYADTYTAYRQGDARKVAANNELSLNKYPLGKHRPKFIFLNSMTLLQAGDDKQFLAGLKEVVQNYPENEITELAGHILKGVQSGRSLAGGGGSLGNIWERRRADYVSDSVAVDSIAPLFDPERQAPYVFILAYEEGTVNENTLLYEVARYNFSTFVVKNFDLSFEHSGGIGMLQVRIFTNLEEAHQYQHQLYADKSMAERLKGLRAVIISEDNYELLMKYYSFDEYDMFYQEYLAPASLKEINLDYIEFDE